LTADIARERDLTIDEAGFEVEMAAQRQRARDAGKFAIDYNSLLKLKAKLNLTVMMQLKVKVKLLRSIKMANKLMKSLKVTKPSSY
jgi:alanyl-tRNA synthetase